MIKKYYIALQILNYLIEKKKYSLDNSFHTIKDILNNNSLLNKKEKESDKNIIHNAIIKKKIYLSCNKKLRNLNIEKIFPDYINNINNFNINKSLNYDMKINSKYRINTQIEKINNKLFVNSNDNEFDTLIKNKPNYYINVLNKNNINNLKSYLNNKNYPKYEINNNRTIKSPKSPNNKLNDLNIKELQKLYYDIDLDNFQKLNLDKSKKNIFRKNNKYKFENYASNNNIFNHPKLYILDIKEKNNFKLPKIKNKANEITINLEYERKKNNKIKFQQSYYNLLSSILNK